MAELADALDLGSSAARHAGSTPVTRTILNRGNESEQVFWTCRVRFPFALSETAVYLAFLRKCFNCIIGHEYINK